MQTNKKIIENIKNKYTILDYMESIGFSPEKKSGNRYAFLSPFYAGDIDPSFFIFCPNDEPQSFYCFGSSQGGDIFTLRKILEKKSFKDILSSYEESNDITNIDSLTESDIISIITEKSFLVDVNRYDIEISMWRLSRLFYDYMKFCSFDKKEIEFIEKISKTIDSKYQKKKYIEIIDGFEYIKNKLIERKKNISNGKI
jgi:hypothetical protein